MRRDRKSPMPDFEMEMITCSAPALSYSSNRLSLSYTLTKPYQVVMVMRVDSDNLCLMLKDNNTSIPTRPPTTKNDLSICRSLYRSSSRRLSENYP